jgi:hypothetical protein
MYNVNNVSKDFLNYKYSVIRDCDGEYWYYGSYNSLEQAQDVCNEIGNGLIVESKNIKVAFFSNW